MLETAEDGEGENRWQRGFSRMRSPSNGQSNCTKLLMAPWLIYKTIFNAVTKLEDDASKNRSCIKHSKHRNDKICTR